MKQFIVLCVTLPLMLFMLMQFVLNETNSIKLSAATDVVYAVREDAKQTGYFTDEMIDAIKTKIAAIYECSESEVKVNAYSDAKRPKIRTKAKAAERLIDYDVSFPVGRRFVTLGLMRLDDKSYVYHIKGSTPSEFVK